MISVVDAPALPQGGGRSRIAATRRSGRASSASGSKVSVGAPPRRADSRYSAISGPRWAADSRVQIARQPEDHQREDDEPRRRPAHGAVARVPPAAAAERENEEDNEDDQEHGISRVVIVDRGRREIRSKGPARRSTAEVPPARVTSPRRRAPRSVLAGLPERASFRVSTARARPVPSVDERENAWTMRSRHQLEVSAARRRTAMDARSPRAYPGFRGRFAASGHGQGANCGGPAGCGGLGMPRERSRAQARHFCDGMDAAKSEALLINAAILAATHRGLESELANGSRRVDTADLASEEEASSGAESVMMCRLARWPVRARHPLTLAARRDQRASAVLTPSGAPAADEDRGRREWVESKLEKELNFALYGRNDRGQGRARCISCERAGSSLLRLLRARCARKGVLVINSRQA